MEINQYHITPHAAQRMAQRNLDAGDLAIVLRYGRQRHCAGAKFYFLGARDIPTELERTLTRLVGTVIVTERATLTTVYRNQDAWRDIKRKCKRDLRPQWQAAQRWAARQQQH